MCYMLVKRMQNIAISGVGGSRRFPTNVCLYLYLEKESDQIVSKLIDFLKTSVVDI